MHPSFRGAPLPPPPWRDLLPGAATCCPTACYSPKLPNPSFKPMLARDRGYASGSNKRAAAELPAAAMQQGVLSEARTMLQFRASPRLDTACMVAFPAAMGPKPSLACPFLLLGQRSLALGMAGLQSRRRRRFAQDKREQQLPQGKRHAEPNVCPQTSVWTREGFPFPWELTGTEPQHDSQPGKGTWPC